MKLNTALSARLAVSEALIITFITLLCLPSTTSATLMGNVSPRKMGGSAVVAARAPLVGLIEVNTTSDAGNLDPSAGCDTDAATPGEQCSLRAAIQRANALAGEDEININIPSNQPNCTPDGVNCTINLTNPLPDLSTSLRIVNSGLVKVTVRRHISSADFSVFRVTAAGNVTLSGLRITNGRPFGIAAGGGIDHAGTGTVNVVDCTVFDNVGGTIVASGGGLANNNSGTLNVINSVITGNKATSAGGGILNGSSGTLNVISSAIVHNTIDVPVAAGRTGHGGGIANSNQGAVNITNSVIGDNIIQGGDAIPLKGGGVMNASTGTITLTNSIVSNNFLAAAGEGGGVYNVAGSALIRNSTIIQNRGKVGGVFGQATVQSSVIAKNNSGALPPDVSGTFISQGFNLIGVADGSTGFNSATDMSGSLATPLDPKFDPNGVALPNVPTPVPGLPLCGSPVLDKGASGGLNTDLRGAGFARIVDDPDETNADDGADIGAFERQTPCADVTFTVNTTSDAGDPNPGDGICDSDIVAPGSQCSLRAAMKESNAIGGDYTINFAIPTSDPGFDPGTGRHTINLTGALPEITESNLTINGPGKERLTVRRQTGGFYRIFTFGNIVETATISGLTVSNSFNSAGDGGALAFSGKALTINSCVFSDNIASGSGGALVVSATLNVIDSTFTNNFSSAASGGFRGGGAIHARGRLNVANSEFVSNIANGLGGAINTDTLSANAESQIANSLFNGNSADAGGGVAVGTFTLPLRIVNSTFDGNTSTILNSKGGGIYHFSGKLEIIGSTLRANEGYGLAIAGLSSISTTVSDSTIADNTFGGIETELATVSTGKLNVSNSTISGNKGNSGIFISRTTLNVSNSTITGNEGAGISGTLATDPGVWTIKSSIIAGNAGFTDVAGTFTSNGFNLIGDASHSTGFQNGVNNDQVGTSTAPIDPRFDPAGLKDNGGTTYTIALQPNSPAIDAGSSDGLERKLDSDQRQLFARTFDDPAMPNASDGTDVGAFELQPGGPTPVPTPTPTPTPIPVPSPTPTPSPSPSPSPTPTPGEPHLVVTITSLVRSNCGSIAVGVTVQNSGNAAANNVRLTTGTLASPATNGTPLPQNLGKIAPGQMVTNVITFSGTNHPAKQKRTLSFGGTYNGGTFSEEWKVTLP